MYDLKRLGANIRRLRNAYGETQEQLGAAIYVEKNTISSYETGTREPKKDTLSAIARHYMVSVEELLYSDYSDIGKIEIDGSALWKNIDVALPLVSSELAMKNEHFSKGYAIHKEFYEKLKQGSLDGVDKIDVCFEEYLEAYDDESIAEEAAANLIALWYLLIIIIKSPYTIMKDKPAALMQIAARDQKVRVLIEAPSPDLEKDIEDTLKEIDDPDFEELVSQLMITLKHSSRWSDLADYYLALQYLWNLVNNDLTAGFNCRVGAEMLHTLVSVENLYAAKFLKLSIDSTRSSSSRTVDDNN